MMTGYRQHSFDPNAYEQAGAPLRPYNWVQWTGVAIGSVGLTLTTLHVLGRIGWLPTWIDDPSPGSLILLLVGVALINSRREPSSLAGSEQLARNRRLLVIAIAICAAVLGAALVIEFQGA